MKRSELVQVLNNHNLTSTMTALKKCLLDRALMVLSEDDTVEDKHVSDNRLLDSVGPAAASAAVEYTINVCKRHNSFKDIQFSGSYIHNVRMLQNADHNDSNAAGQYSNFSNVMRQFLLPRYAYLDFDTVVDPRHHIDAECGYPKFITPIMYRYMYDRDDMARRITDIYPDECWAAELEIHEDESEDDTKPDSPFVEDFKTLCLKHDLIQVMYRIDRLSGIGHYGALLMGLDDTDDLEQPVNEPELLAGKKWTVATKQRELLYLRPFDEYLSFVMKYDTNSGSPRYGLPEIYNLVFLDMTIDAAGASIGTRLNRRVHWTRVHHIVDNLQASRTFGTPRMQPVFNRLLDLRKLKGGSAEMFWKGAHPGLAFEIDPQFASDDVDFDQGEFTKQIQEYSEGLRRYIDTLGVKVTSLAPNIAEPHNHVMIQLQAIAAHKGIPLRILMGSEEGKQASGQDKLNWNGRLKQRVNRQVTPGVVRPILDRFVAIGVMRPPKKPGVYICDWDDLNTPTDEDKANLSLKWTQAFSQYVQTGMIYLISPMDYFTVVVGFTPAIARRCMKYIEGVGGIEKLKQMYLETAPAANNPNAGGGGSSGARNSSDKSVEGMSS